MIVLDNPMRSTALGLGLSFKLSSAITLGGDEAEAVSNLSCVRRFQLAKLGIDSQIDVV